MKKALVILICVFALSLCGFSQQTPRNLADEVIPTTLFQVTYGAQFTGMDTKASFGFTNTIGGSVIYKTKNNLLLTANGNFIFGNQLKGDRIDIFGEGITTTTGEIIGGGGLFTALALFQRGLHFQAEVGKLFSFKPNPNSGFFIQGGVGYLRNRIRVEYQVEAMNPPYQLDEDYQYGYDQMRGGFALHGEAGYLILSNSRVLNFSVSLEVTYARTRHLRDYDFRVFYDESGEPYVMGYNDKSKRFNDLYYGIRLSWMIPTYQRQPDAYYYY
ncbi:MAG: hypothetical protein K6A28_03900 [Bacteroidales bacterium]|nr:hypothetical protein [Bacteroidales bacterium]